jgi:hypothetical protein
MKSSSGRASRVAIPGMDDDIPRRVSDPYIIVLTVEYSDKQVNPPPNRGHKEVNKSGKREVVKKSDVSTNLRNADTGRVWPRSATPDASTSSESRATCRTMITHFLRPGDIRSP